CFFVIQVSFLCAIKPKSLVIPSASEESIIVDSSLRSEWTMLCRHSERRREIVCGALKKSLAFFTMLRKLSLNQNPCIVTMLNLMLTLMPLARAATFRAISKQLQPNLAKAEPRLIPYRKDDKWGF
ncbi:MAG: hypothetical protein NZM06_02250, partial [Chloroherpetonaceae bacterium]|nr:hypothetical protein [Chloroherpetonaceae bacterium]